MCILAIGHVREIQHLFQNFLMVNKMGEKSKIFTFWLRKR